MSIYKDGRLYAGYQAPREAQEEAREAHLQAIADNAEKYADWANRGVNGAKITKVPDLGGALVLYAETFLVMDK